MSSWRNSFIAALLLLSACGFEPMYGDAAHRNSTTLLEGNLSVDGGTQREGQLLRNDIEDKFNPEGLVYAHPEYHLHLALVKTLVSSIVQSDGTIQRYDVHLDSTYTLMQDGVKTPILTGTVSRIGSYNVISNGEYATYMADRDVTERTINEMAEDYMLRLTSYFATKAKPAT